MTWPASDLPSVAILGEDVLSALCEVVLALMKVAIRGVVVAVDVGYMIEVLERIGSRKKGRTDILKNVDRI